VTNWLGPTGHFFLMTNWPEKAERETGLTQHCFTMWNFIVAGLSCGDT